MGQPHFQHATFCEQTETAAFLLERGAGLEEVDSSGQTALHFAARVGGYGAVQLLAQKGANLEAADESGLTPLAWAVFQSQSECSITTPGKRG